MTSGEFRDRLAARAERAGVLVDPNAATQLEVYFELLARWNTKINLTALPLTNPTDQTFDRLLIEPMAAAQHVTESPGRWVDVGSGGGSPAIPMRIVHRRADLTLVESKARKAAFLREAVRVLALEHVHVAVERFEAFAGANLHAADLIILRAVRIDATMFADVHRSLSSKGKLFLFHSATTPPAAHQEFRTVETFDLQTGSGARLTILEPMFHVEQSG